MATKPRPSHPWAVLDGERVLFHVAGTHPPEYAPDAELEALWRAGHAAPIGVPKKMPHVGRGPNSKFSDKPYGIQAYRDRDAAPGVPRKMPLVGGRAGMGEITHGVQSHRRTESYTMTDKLKSPFPWPGGKSDQAGAIWARLGDVANFVEPFAGSAAVLLARGHDLTGKTETLNDIDGFITCALRSITYAPEETAYYCDRPVNEIDLTAYHLWLKAQRPDLTERLFADPFYHDPVISGAWLWGIASWIGDGWCVADGPWINVDGRLVDRRTIGSDADGVTKQTPMVNGRDDSAIRNGIQAYRAPGVPRKMPEVGRSPNGQMEFNRKGVQAYRHHDGVPKQIPNIGAGNMKNGVRRAKGGGYAFDAGVQFQRRESDSALLAYFARLSDRLRRVRFLCGDWRRAVKDSVTVNHGLSGIMLDPPYPQAEHDMGYHATESGDVWYQAAAWAVEHGDDPRLRIAIAGYYSEATDALFPATWERVRWEARGGYANQKANGRGRANAKREILFFSPHCLNPADEARDTMSRPIVVRDSDYSGTMFEEEDDADLHL